jgi:hypothetical protein
MAQEQTKVLNPDEERELYQREISRNETIA